MTWWPKEPEHQQLWCCLSLSGMHVPVLVSVQEWLTHWGWVTHICISKLLSLFQIMAWCLFGDNPLLEPMMVYCQLDPREDISLKLYLKFKGFSFMKVLSAKLAFDVILLLISIMKICILKNYSPCFLVSGELELVFPSCLEDWSHCSWGKTLLCRFISIVRF